MTSFLAQNLRRKAERALSSARELQDRDPDGSVNRSYYAMFDIARAALLSVGIREDELPKTHNGVISLFSKHAVQTGRVDSKVSGALGRAETLRLTADYTGTSLDAKAAAETVTLAEAFMAAVGKAFVLNESSFTSRNTASGARELVTVAPAKFRACKRCGSLQ